ncbi:MAG: galactitol-1-phosphate 5-dehydrogenase [Bacteroidetes bacterium GWF2_42_66]|nr:MAG: galactitol-1-phosphate 5-dehydrogenase [Bacteroidetes bacterium GWA2_42_15]OFY01689.1 MAG: galactitol-1-phosphate 5-dehydrogenase [Bacteroidetes bacterium GWE2_42_39]OFY41019.1 MAG: galactitol-1-phosphate 5-dehydrogenase [Bacteroidetes bacterium GWF2_42_66]HBL76612.1 galactitol-1-phosphate 5-dehydrogenase [Prolixibacteraceae bacterium]HCR92002.1 galactitol-1-phosphate 5-dehydrogenase [Prolixibacteraceae bacterium]
MKALVLEAYNQFKYTDVPVPEISDDEVLVRVKACGICGSDVHGMDGSTGRRIPPIIMGHEASGVIEKVGKNVTNWQPGDRVTFDSTIYPLDDWYTLHGRYNLSDNRKVLGVSPGDYRKHGAFAEYVSVPQHILYRIPNNVSFEHAAMVEPVAVALHAISLSGIKLGDTAVVVGVGMIGIFIVKLLKLSGIKVIAIDLDDAKLEQAKLSGADVILNAQSENLERSVKEICNGRGADFAFEAVGVSATVTTAITSVRKGGTIILVGNLSSNIEFPLQKVVTQELKVLGSCAINGEYEKVLQLMEQGLINVDDQISAIAPLSEGAGWFSRLHNKEKGLNKILLVP